MSKTPQKRVRVEFYLLLEDAEVLVRMAEARMTTRGDLVREALYAHFPELKDAEHARVERVYNDVVSGGILELRKRLSR